MELESQSKVYYVVLAEDLASVGSTPGEVKKVMIYEPFFRKELALPTLLPFTFVMGVLIVDPSKNALTAEFRDPEGKTLSTIILNDIIFSDEDNLDEIQSFSANISASTLGFEMELYGEYSFVVLLNGETELGRASVLIKPKSDDANE